MQLTDLQKLLTALIHLLLRNVVVVHIMAVCASAALTAALYAKTVLTLRLAVANITIHSIIPTVT